MIFLSENDPDILDECIKTLAAGGVLLVPTETVYGLVCDYENMAAREKIYQLKKRDKNKLLGAFLPDIAFLPSNCNLPEKGRILAEKLMPGGLTLVIPDGSGGTFGFRIPDHPFMQRLLKSYGKVLAQTSANLSGTPPALSVKEALSTLVVEEGEISLLIVDGGNIPCDSLSSTVVYVDDEKIKILREGAISGEKINEILL